MRGNRITPTKHRFYVASGGGDFRWKGQLQDSTIFLILFKSAGSFSISRFTQVTKGSVLSSCSMDPFSRSHVMHLSGLHSGKQIQAAQTP